MSEANGEFDNRGRAQELKLRARRKNIQSILREVTKRDSESFWVFFAGRNANTSNFTWFNRKTESGLTSFRERVGKGESGVEFGYA